MNNKIFLISLLMLMFSFSFVMGANSVTLNTPSATDSISGATYVLNGTLDSNTDVFTNATFWYCIDNAGTCTSWVFIGTLTNDTVAQLNYTMTWDTASIVDTMNMTFNITVTDVTGVNLTEDTSVTVSIDNGNPTATLASTSLKAASQLYSDTSFILAIDADNTIGIENCTAYFTLINGSSYTSSVTASAEACSQSFTPSSFGLPAGDYTSFITVFDDNADDVNSSSRAISVYETTTIGGSGGEPAIIESVDTSITDGVGVGVAPEKNIVFKAFDSVIDFFRKLFTWNWN